MTENRNEMIDFIKGIAIIAVVLYHLGILSNGYLGVDIFLVINGYLIMKSVIKNKNDIRDFSLLGFMVKRIIRLWPVLLVGCIFAIALGYFVMLPDDYENLSETVVASVCGANNILQVITTHNYWDAVQEYKPLMHTWYLGVVIQFYAVYGIYTFIVCKCFKHNLRIYMGGIIALTFMSFILYIMPGDTANKFYYLQYRFWELGVGAVLAVVAQKGKIKLENDNARKIMWGSIVILTVLMAFPGSYKESVKEFALIITVIVSAVALYIMTFGGEMRMKARGGRGYVESECIVTVYTYGIRL
ncbi:MAG: acyltransferase [Clostridiales bacterium]|nr:acyltransferase [Clostridiales bacterium]